MKRFFLHLVAWCIVVRETYERNRQLVEISRRRSDAIKKLRAEYKASLKQHFN